MSLLDTSKMKKKQKNLTRCCYISLSLLMKLHVTVKLLEDLVLGNIALFFLTYIYLLFFCYKG